MFALAPRRRAVLLLAGAALLPAHAGAARTNGTAESMNLRASHGVNLLCICGGEDYGYSVAKELFRKKQECKDKCSEKCRSAFQTEPVHLAELEIDSGCVSYSELLEMSERRSAALQHEEKRHQQAFQLKNLDATVGKIGSAEQKLTETKQEVSKQQGIKEKELTRLKAEADRLPGEIGKAMGQLAELNRTRKTLEVRARELPGRIKEASRRQDEKERELQSLKTRKDVSLPAIISEQEARVNAKHGEVGTLTVQYDQEMPTKLASAKSERERLQVSVERLTNEVAELQLELAQKVKDLETTQLNLTTAEKREEELRKEQADIKQRLNARQEELKVLNERQTKLQEELKVTQSEGEELEKKLGQAKGDHDALEKERKKVQQDRSRIEEELKEIDATHGTLQQELKNTHKQQKDVEAQLEELQGQKEKLEIQLETTRASHEAKKMEKALEEAEVSQNSTECATTRLAATNSSGVENAEKLAILPALVGAVTAATMGQSSDQICCMCGGPGDTRVFSGGNFNDDMKQCKGACAGRCKAEKGEIEPLWGETNGCVKERDIARSMEASGIKFQVQFGIMDTLGDFC